MHPDEQYRAFLLGMADTETEASIEEGLLEDRIDPAYLQQIEEELIDDHLFRRLSTEQEDAFHTQFIGAPGRAEKLRFIAALKQYANRHAPAATRLRLSQKLRKWVEMPWILPLAGTLACALLAVIWLAQRNSSLTYQLAQSATANNEHQRLIASMLQEQRQRALQSAVAAQLTAQLAHGDATLQPAVNLSPGATRGLAVLPMLYIGTHASTANIVLELPFHPAGILREELQDSAGQTIWKQEFAVTAALSNHGTTTILLPVGLLATGQYNLRAQNDVHGEKSGDEATYQFRVRKD